MQTLCPLTIIMDASPKPGDKDDGDENFYAGGLCVFAAQPNEKHGQPQGQTPGEAQGRPPRMD